MEKVNSDSVGHASEISPSPARSSPELADKELGIWQAVTKYRKVVLYCVGLSSAVLLYGYDQAIVGSVSGLPVFQ